MLISTETVGKGPEFANEYALTFSFTNQTEMNMHFPQSLIAQAEARLIANTDNQYLVPTSGNPLRGLIQDHVVAGVWLTNKDTFFTREQYQQLIYGALRTENDYSGNGMILTLPPTIWKPVPMWTGKQVVSSIE